MRKYFSILSLFIICSFFFIHQDVKAEDACQAKVILHYHRFNEDYDNYELYTWNFDSSDEELILLPTHTDAFGAVFEINICNDAQNEIGIVLKEVGTWNKDGIDANKDGEIDNKTIDVSDLKGTANTKHVYILQGANEVFYQDNSKANYLGKPNHGHVVIIYYNPNDSEANESISTWGRNDDINAEQVAFNYHLGLDGGTNPNLFNVGIINVGYDAFDQIGFNIEKMNDSWIMKDTSWTENMTENMTDENGHTYLLTGDRMINVSDIKGAGFKFIYVMNGEKTLFEDFNFFKSEAFKLEFTKALFNSKNTLIVELNDGLSYSDTSINSDNIEVTDQEGNAIPIHNVSQINEKTYKIVLDSNIKEGNQYTVMHHYNQFDEQKTTFKDTTVTQDIFTEKNEEERNYTGFIIAGITVVALIGVGTVILRSRIR